MAFNKLNSVSYPVHNFVSPDTNGNAIKKSMNIQCKENVAICLFVLMMLVNPQIAFAYIGPGLGAGAVAAVIGIAAGVLMLIVGVVWYPLKRFIKYLIRKK